MPSDVPDVLLGIKFWCGFEVCIEQIRTVLNYVPVVFPEDWKSPECYEELSYEEKIIYWHIANSGQFNLTGPEIQRIIELGVEYRDQYSTDYGR